MPIARPSPIAAPAWSVRLLWSLPPMLIAIRFLLGPFLFLNAQNGAATIPFLAGLTFAFLSDVFDGVIARRAGRVTARLREADGWTDVWFYPWIAASVWQSHRAVVIALARPLLLVISLQLLAWLIDWLKYRRFSNYHAYSAKLWGITLFLANIALFGFNRGGIYLWLAIIAGLLCTLEEIAITLTLDQWTYDVPSLLHARRLQRQQSQTE